MAIEYGFGSLNPTPEVRGSWVQLYQSLNDSEKEYFHQVFPPLMMAAGISHISEDTIPHILARLDVMDACSRRPNTYRDDFEVLHVLAERGMEAAKKFQEAKKQARELVKASLDGFEPDAAAALRRYIGFTTNVGTETSQQFLTSLVNLRFNAFPKLTKAEDLREDKAFRAYSKEIASGAQAHPALTPEVVTA